MGPGPGLGPPGNLIGIWGPPLRCGGGGLNPGGGGCGRPRGMGPLPLRPGGPLGGNMPGPRPLNPNGGGLTPGGNGLIPLMANGGGIRMKGGLPLMRG